MKNDTSYHPGPMPPSNAAEAPSGYTDQIMEHLFVTQSVLIRPLSPQAAQQGVHIYCFRINSL